MKRLAGVLLLVLATSGVGFAALPPELVNFQGVLRDPVTGAPYDGTFQITLRFYDAEQLGSLLLTDVHQNVIVTGGLFNVHIGGGTLVPGTHGTLSEVFAHESTVWLEFQVDTETLDLRVQFLAGGYALNASYLDGRDATEFLDTSSTAQTKAGRLRLEVPENEGGNAIVAIGDYAGGFFKDVGGSAETFIALNNLGLRAHGSVAGGRFFDTDNSGFASVATGDIGIEAEGDEAGGSFVALAGTAVVGLGEVRGGYFEDTTDADTGKAHLAIFNTGVEGEGSVTGGRFYDTNDSGFAEVGTVGKGIAARGSVAGGHFTHWDSSGEAYLGYGDRGIQAHGSAAGYFEATDGDAKVTLAQGNTGIQAEGSWWGGMFSNTDGDSFVDLAVQDVGINASGNEMGGYFYDRNDDGWAWVGYGGKGIEAHGSFFGGRFHAFGESGYAYVGYHHRGIEAFGNYTGGWFTDLTSGSESKVAFDIWKISGNGAVGFVQNHPYEQDRVIVYAAPEGDEVATYTRGTARLTAGSARVPLGDTFQWVTNPDIGLTAHVTARGDCLGLYVESLSTDELVVRELGGGGGDVVFDYIVYGLRIGFEEASVIQEKNAEARIPSMRGFRELYERSPEFREYNALERFKAMRLVKGEREELDLSTSVALKNAIEEFDPAIHAVSGPGPNDVENPPDEALTERAAAPESAAVPTRPPSRHSGGARRGDLLPVDDEGNVYAKSFRPNGTDMASFVPVTESVEPGDVVVIDLDRPGMMGLARAASDPRVFGIVAGEPGLVLGQAPPMAGVRSVEGTGGQVEPANPSTVDTDERAVTVHAPVAVSGLARCKVDAGYGPIRPGDLLTTSPTPGHAMLAHEPRPGTILGKALEPLETGSGQIKVLVMLR